jgi:hypothetical protein
MAVGGQLELHNEGLIAVHQVKVRVGPRVGSALTFTMYALPYQ